MEILKPGRPKPSSFTGTCTSCGCRVRCSRDEVRYDPDPRGQGGPYVECPTAGCGQWIWLKPEKG